MRHASRSDDECRRLPVAMVVVTVTLGLLAAGCSGSGASTDTVQTLAATSTAEGQRSGGHRLTPPAEPGPR